jgi:anti-sigma regulatory factor (Ser/Thr protein kinase)
VLARWLRDAGATRMEIEEVALACSEACANAIEHAYGPAPARLEVTATIAADQAVDVCVRDFGTWREPRREHKGRGQVLMAGLMDTVDIDRSDGGTAVRLTRRLGREDP